MQDPSTYTQIKPQFPEQEHLKCPRCDSSNTKFCYYNNYNLSQPRHFCKNCKRYWTKGGTLRNIPVGGGSRKNTKRSAKRSPAATSPASSNSQPHPKPEPEPEPIYGLSGFDQDRRMLDINGSLSFSSLLASSGQFGNLLEDPGTGSLSGMTRNPGVEYESGGSINNNNTNNSVSASFLGDQSGGESCWNNTHGWPDLAIFTPGSTFQ